MGRKKKDHHAIEFEMQQLADLSHDMRTPLSIIMSTVQLLEDRADEKCAPELAQIRRNAQQLLRLLGNIHDLAAIDAGWFRLRMQPVEGVGWLREVGLACAPYARHKGVEFTYVSNLDALWISCDPVRLERCVLNLISNAVRCTDAGGLICLCIEKVGDEACISVSDNGCGMSEAQLKQPFSRPMQLDGGNPNAGSGLGLPLVKTFMELMDGRFELESERGEGTRASLFLRSIDDPQYSAHGTEVFGPAASSAAVELAELMRPKE